MKKLMIMAAVMSAAVAAQAEITVNWTMSDETYSAYTAYVMKQSDDVKDLLSAWSSVEVQSGLNKLKNDNLAATIAVDRTINGLLYVNESDFIWNNFGPVSVTKGEYLVFLINSDETEWASGDLKISLTKNPDQSYSSTHEYTSDTSWATLYHEAVPEPTSGVLMLLGLAGLALKRKRA